MLIWIKRIAPFVVIAVALYAWLEISQRRVETEHSHIRYALLESDDHLESMLAFAGPKQ